ncbi:MAG: Phospho-N-acetylmuramoyl-pentapeptide-transferase, partial [uncultured Microvirga sp.]
ARAPRRLQRLAQRAQRLPLHHLPQRRRDRDRADVRVLVRPRHHHGAAPETGQGAADPRGRPEIPPRDEARHAHHGRAHDPRRHARRHLPLGEPAQPLCLGGGDRHDRFWGDRLLRRLPQGDEAVPQGLFGQCAPGARGDDRCRRLRDGGIHRHARTVEQARAALCEGADLRSRLVLRGLRRLCDRGRRKRGQHHGRARRPRHRAGDDRGRHLRLHRVSGRQRDLRQLPPDPFRARHRRTRGGAGRGGRGRARLPLVQR